MGVRYFKEDFPTEEERKILDDNYICKIVQFKNTGTERVIIGEFWWGELKKGKVEGEVNRGNDCTLKEYIDMLTMTKGERSVLREEGCISYGFIFDMVRHFDYNAKPSCEFKLEQIKEVQCDET